MSSQRQTRRGTGPITSLQPSIFGRKPAEVTLFPFRLGNSHRGWSLHWLYDSFPSLKAKFSIWEGRGGHLKGKWPRHHPRWQMAIIEKRI